MRCAQEAELQSECCKFVGNGSCFVVGEAEIGRGKGVADVDHNGMGLAIPFTGLKDDVVSNTVTNCQIMAESCSKVAELHLVVEKTGTMINF